MEAKELRIGNWVTDEFYDHFKTVIRVTSINEKGINLTVQDDGNYAELANNFIEPEYTFDKLYGIPLSLDILEKAGFKADRSGWHLPGSQFSLTDKFYPCWLDRMLWPQDINDFKETKLEYVHQLQNLLFALTGEDLSLQL